MQYTSQAFLCMILLLSSCYDECTYAENGRSPEEYTSVIIHNKTPELLTEVFYPQIGKGIKVNQHSVRAFPLLNGFDITKMVLIFSNNRRDTIDFVYNRVVQYDTGCEDLYLDLLNVEISASTLDSSRLSELQLTIFE